MKIVTLGSRMLSPLLAEKAPLFGLWNQMGASISIEKFPSKRANSCGERARCLRSGPLRPWCKSTGEQLRLHAWQFHVMLGEPGEWSCAGWWEEDADSNRSRKKGTLLWSAPWFLSCSPEDLSSHLQVIDCLTQWWPSKCLVTSSLNIVLNIDLFMSQ